MDMKHSVKDNLTILEYEDLKLVVVEGVLETSLDKLIQELKLKGDQTREVGKVLKLGYISSLGIINNKPRFVETRIERHPGSHIYLLSYAFDLLSAINIGTKTAREAEVLISEVPSEGIQRYVIPGFVSESIPYYEKIKSKVRGNDQEFRKMFAIERYACFLKENKGYSEPESSVIAAKVFEALKEI